MAQHVSDRCKELFKRKKIYFGVTCTLRHYRDGMRVLLTNLQCISFPQDSDGTYCKTKLRIWLLSKDPRIQHSTSVVSKCDCISWIKVTSISNFDVINVCTIQACIRDSEGAFAGFIFICEDSGVKSRNHDFILRGIQEYI